MALSKRQLKEIEEAINQRFIRFTYEALGERALTPAEITKLQRAGLLRRGTKHMIGDPYTLGKIAALMDRGRASRMSYEDVLDAAKKMSKITEVEKRAIEWASLHAGEHIKGLRDDMVREARTLAATRAGAALREVRAGVKEAIAARKTASELKTDLFHTFDDVNRDWQRVAVTEMTQAVQNSIYGEIAEKSKNGLDQLVYKRPEPNACKHCRRLYLRADGIMPRIFKLRDLADTNVGRKANSWLPTIGPVHPWCYPAGHLVTTRRGEIPIENVVVGDEVITHKGHWRRVSRLSRREWSGELVVLKVGEKILKSTPEHPYLKGQVWLPALELNEGDNLFQIIPNKIVFEDIEYEPTVARQIPKFLGVIQVDGFAKHLYSTSVIAKKSKEYFSGTVYNLAVEEDESFLCEGIISHNCQCQLIPVIEGYDFEKKKVVVQPFEKDGKKYKLGQIIEDPTGFLEEKLGWDAVLTYTGTTPTLTKSLIPELPSEEEGCCFCHRSQ